MKIAKLAVLMLVVLLAAGNLFGQSRNGQIELYGGVGFPLKPDGFKDFYKLGLSLHGQYVMFPSPQLGISLGAAYERFSLDEDAVLDAFGLTADDDVSISGNASIVEFGVGLRPYLTPQEASTQFFLFGVGTFNLVKDEAEVTFTDLLGNEQTVGGSVDENVFGVAVGAGLELPAGESMNIILQGLARFIFADKVTDGETLSFIGVTAGLVF